MMPKILLKYFNLIFMISFKPTPSRNRKLKLKKNRNILEIFITKIRFRASLSISSEQSCKPSKREKKNILSFI